MAKTSSSNTLNKKHLLGYALGDLGCCVTFFTMSNFLTRYYITVSLVDTAILAAMTFLWKIWDGLCSPVFGIFMDKYYAKHKDSRGKFRPWMFRSAPLVAITAILVFTAPNLVTGASRLVVIFTTYLLYQFAYTIFNVPYGTLLSAMAKTDEERASLSSLRGIGSLLGSMVPLIFFPVLLSSFEHNLAFGYGIGITICAVIGFLACFLSYFFTEERNLSLSSAAKPVQLSDAFRSLKINRPFAAMCLHGLSQGASTSLSAAISSYMYSDVYHNLAMMSLGSMIMMPLSIAFLFLTPKLTKKIGLNRLIRISLLIGISLYLILFGLHITFPVPLWLHIVLFSLASGFSGVSGMMQWGLMGEAIAYNEVLTGKRAEGTLYGTFNMIRRIGQAIGTSAGVALLGFIGFDAALSTSGLSQSATTIFGIKALCLFAPALLSFGSFVAFRFIWKKSIEIPVAEEE